MKFDRKAAFARLQQGMSRQGSSTQSWDADIWSLDWRDDDGQLVPGTLASSGGAWWFRALTDPDRLTGTPENPPDDPLTVEEAQQRMRSFRRAADKALRHWPRHAIALITFPLREAFGPQTTLEILNATVNPEHHPDFVRWLGPLSIAVANELLTAVTDPNVLTVLADLGAGPRHVVDRLTAIGAMEQADALAERLDVDERARWRLKHRRPVTIELLEEALEVVDDATWLALTTLLLRDPGPRVWRLIAARPLPDTARVQLPQALQSSFQPAPDLPSEEWADWMTTVSDRGPTNADPWLDKAFLPELRTRSGYRLPPRVRDGLLGQFREGAPELANITEALDPASLAALWNALFQMWTVDKTPDGRWVLRTLGSLGDDHVLREAAGRLSRHRHWYGDFADDIIDALADSRNAWAVVLLDDIARGARSPQQRQRATELLRGAAHDRGVEVDRYVETHFPGEQDDLLAALATRRLEEALGEGRCWTEWTWRQLVRVPSFEEVARRLLWTLRDDYDELTVARWDGEQLLDLHDDVVELEDAILVSLSHSTTLDDGTARAWHDRFAEYEVVQPFDQLARARFRCRSLSADGYRSPGSREFDAELIVRKAEAFKWVTYTAGAHGAVTGVRRDFPWLDVRAELPFRTTGRRTRLEPIRFATLHGTTIPDEDVDPIAFSEAHRDLMLFLG